MYTNKKLIMSQDIYKYLIKNPVWVSAFTSGEGSFTGSFLVDKRATWGMWPQAEFNISQLMTDEQLLTAIKLFFDGCGGVYNRTSGVGCYAVRDLTEIQTTIIPFFHKYPILGAKGYEFDKWVNYVQLISKKRHLASELDGRDSLVECLDKLMLLNQRDTRQAVRKGRRNAYLVNWLKSLTTTPTSQQKLEMIQHVKSLRTMSNVSVND